MLNILIDFVKENWKVFLQRCEECGMSDEEEEVEKEITKLRERNE